MHYIITHQIIKPEIGRTIDSLPLHITLMPWFTIEKPQSDLLDCLDAFTNRQQKIRLKIGQDALFGTNKNIAVSLLENSAELSDFHLRLLSALEEIKPNHIAPQWIGENWNPHITHKTNNRLNEGDEILLDTIDLIYSSNFKQGDRTNRTPTKRYNF